MNLNALEFPRTLVRPELLHQECWLNGQWQGGDPDKRLPVINPATGAILAHVPNMGYSVTSQAIANAQSALAAWRARTGKQRSVILKRWAQLMHENADDLSNILTAEQGKPLNEASSEIAYAASFLDWFAEEAKRIDGDILQSPVSGQRLLVLRQPIGVCAAITPWNFPAAMITRKVGPALAAGCVIIVKPAEHTPLTALALAHLAYEAGVPGDVFQVVTGEPEEIGNALCESDIVRKLSFTGSTDVGRMLMAKCAPTVKKLSLELGGNAPFIVFDDADLDEAMDALMLAKFRNSGQTCICANRVFVQSGIYSALADKLIERTRALKIGDGSAEGIQQGPLIDGRAIRKIQALLEDAVSHGARIALGGHVHENGGTFFEPTIIQDLSKDMRISSEEIFGPVAALYRFDTEADVLELANASKCGLAAYLFTRDHARIWRMSEALEYGMVGVNTAAISNEVGPFGGIKHSGLGREGSKYGIDEYLETKYICMKV
ncbi:NAD-dependent succinate-semialdehyde dehydrogenase [Allopusillimonas ginsengisoli]|uniref:NAD-dependent succinate-semialdehyde dehydrogenase n=1 Tax=Allopusillimonas ginsengisoli TaxID=453575 RepID=UPI00101F30A5|nr:NAD-dependent succinate-semialdehyde dehydrogenase [Allopusillimonas ginsengisoli]TEA76937.1 NAD-dependent succinate-semialdehyde dehydrogenase [Allopusillimonas ginsengisoli]